MARHADLTILTGLPVYFCDPHSPWQRGSNENTNGLLRQYFPNGTDISKHSSDDLEAVAIALNGRPRKALGWRTPAEALDEIMAIERKPMPPGEQQKAKPGARSSAASKDTSCAKSTPRSAQQNHLNFLLDEHRSINALAETINGLYKTEAIHRRGPFSLKSFADGRGTSPSYFRNRLISTR